MISFKYLALVAISFVLLLISQKIGNNNENKKLVRKIIFLMTSYIFIIYADYRFALIIFFISISTWLCSKYEKLILVGIIVAILSLILFKYLDFFAESFARISGNDFTLINMILPIGISFYTLNAISYLADVKSGILSARGIIDVAIYLSYFPKLTSGPIQKSLDFFNELDNNREVGWDTFSPGIQIFIFGLFKKIVLADRLAVFVNQVWKTPLAFSGVTIFLAAIAYSLQIYFDFSGYSDMAIAVSKMLGINLPRNFNIPYIAQNVTEFWKRWHISFSTWLKEYLYIPLGGNRKGKCRTYINLIITMIICGIWHGVNLTFVIWGALHGIALIIHKIWMNKTQSNKKRQSTLVKLASSIVTFLYVTFCWIFFRSEDLSKALLIITRIINFDEGLEQIYVWLFLAIGVLIVALITASISSKKSNNKSNNVAVGEIEGFYPVLDLTKFWSLALFFAICGLTFCFAYIGANPFIYGNF